MKKILLALVAVFLATAIYAQDSDEINLTREQVLAMSIEDLQDLSLEELAYALDIMEVQSVDELFAMIMNKNVSSASKKEEDSFKSPLSTSVITREEMRTFGCTTVEEALRMLPGMIVREKTNGVYDVHVRGLDNIPDGNMFLYSENVNTLVMIDGRPAFNYETGAMLWEALPVGIEDIERIEVVRGASSALYGSNALTGVINIITEKPTTQSKFVSGSFQAGSSSTYVGDVAFRKSFNDKFGFSVSGNYQVRNRPTDKIYIIPDANTYDTRDESINYKNGGWASITDLEYLRKTDTFGEETSLIEAASTANEVFHNSQLARKSLGLNAILYYTPTTDIMFTLSGGYQNSMAMQSGIRYDAFPMHFRQSKQTYVDLTADIIGISLQLNYTTGPQDFMPGMTSFKVKNQQFTGNIEYDWHVFGDFYLRPGVNYRWNNVDDSDYAGKARKPILDAFGDTTTLSGFFNGDASLTAIAPSLRVDYTAFKKLRIIAAYRAEKLSCPDKWYHSGQVAINYAVNDKHDIRLIYSRANRSSIFLNTKVDFDQIRTDYAAPSEAKYEGNKDSKVVSADNFEIGYRVRPVPRLLIDLEAYYTFSRDYGTLMAAESGYMCKSKDLETGFTNLVVSTIVDQLNLPSALVDAFIGPLLEEYGINNYDSNYNTEDLVNAMKTRTTIQYNNLPYKVQSRGISLSLDWIVCKQLVAKVNANLQKTTIDNYFRYNFDNDLSFQITQSYGKLYEAIADLTEMCSDINNLDTNIEKLMTLMNDSFYLADIPDVVAAYESATAMADKDGGAALEAFYQDLIDNDHLNYYYYFKYGVESDHNGHLLIGASTETNHKYEDKHVHKNTPSFYGSIGLLYKPIDQISIAADGYYYTKQTMQTYAGDADIRSKFNLNVKVSYRPIDPFEIYFNAHNILNDHTREFAFTDNVTGIYSVGVNFKF